MLEVRNLHAGYGRMPVLRDVSFSLNPGEILLIGGENGAGKSTLMRTIGGFITPTSGSITLDGKPLVGKAPEDIVRLGLRLVLDGHRIFPEMSVYDNIRLGAVMRGRDRAAFETAVKSIFEVFPILEEKRRNYARDLSGGQQQMLALAQAFVAQPKVLLCDEPSMGLAQLLMPTIMNFLKAWAESGTAVVIVEQHLDAALTVAHRAIVMERGQVAIECPAGDLQDRLAQRASA